VKTVYLLKDYYDNEDCDGYISSPNLDGDDFFRYNTSIRYAYEFTSLEEVERCIKVNNLQAHQLITMVF